MITKQQFEKFLAFTLAEVLITMIIITLMTLASVPVIKKAKEGRDSAKNKHTWAAMYDENDKLVVYVDGAKCTSADCIGGSGDNQFAKFTPPKGVSRINVTVVGGGGGGGAGEAGIGQTKTFFPDSSDKYFVPASDGLYQIIAIGGGGGGGGGGVMCEGGGAYAGGAVIATANLKKNGMYEVLAGKQGEGGMKQSAIGFAGDILFPVAFAGYVAAGAFSAGAAWIIGAWAATGVSAVLKATQPTDRKQGGGLGLASGIDGPNVKIRAEGGCGGEHRRKKGFWPKCKGVGGCEGNGDKGDPTTCEGSGIVNCSAKLKAWKDGARKKRSPGYICKQSGNGYNCKLPGLATALKDINVSQFGNGGNGGGKLDTGKKGQPGLVQIQELPIFGGGGGQAGAVSFYSYTKSPLEEDQEFIEVYPGKGGKGGVSKLSSSEGKDQGSDGTFSRFGQRIIADGGLGGRIRATNADTETFKAEGENGIASGIPATYKNKVKSYITVKLLEEALGGYKHTENACLTNGLGQGNSCSASSKVVAVPGMGGGGGGALGSKNYNPSEIKAGNGGHGGNGIVIVTW